jgi:hypothetical protein
MGEHPHMGQHNVFFTAVVSSDGVLFDPINIGGERLYVTYI